MSYPACLRYKKPKYWLLQFYNSLESCKNLYEIMELTAMFGFDLYLRDILLKNKSNRIDVSREQIVSLRHGHYLPDLYSTDSYNICGEHSSYIWRQSMYVNDIDILHRFIKEDLLTERIIDDVNLLYIDVNTLHYLYLRGYRHRVQPDKLFLLINGRTEVLTYFSKQMNESLNGQIVVDLLNNHTYNVVPLESFVYLVEECNFVRYLPIVQRVNCLLSLEACKYLVEHGLSLHAQCHLLTHSNDAIFHYLLERNIPKQYVKDILGHINSKKRKQAIYKWLKATK